MSAHDRVNILMVDDQPAKLLSYEVILNDLGENLVKANSGREALEYLLKNDVAVILADVCMPELDGFELAQMLREHPRYRTTAIIFISAIQFSDLDRLRGYQSGAVDYVPVPVVPEILRAKVKIFVELWRKTRQLEQLNHELERRVQERTGELEASAAAAREAAERLRLASEAAGFGTYDFDAATGELYWSSYLRKIVGISDDERLTLDSALAVVHSDHRETVRQHLDGSTPAAGRRELEFKIIRPDGEIRWLLDHGQSVTGTVEPGWRVMGTVLDITERKRGEERQRLLMAELDHRVKNILANVSAIVRLSSHRAQSVDAFVTSLDGRIRAISQAHGLLRRGDWSGASLAELASEILSPYRTGGNIGLDGEPITVVPEFAQSMALILHELSTNAIKHGALSTPVGRVKISWSRSPEGLSLIWRESGGPGAAAPDAKGFGLTVLQTAAADLGAVADYQFREEGFVYTLQGPFELGHPVSASLPKPQKAERTVVPNSNARGPSKKQSACRVLVVEDEALIALQLQDDLEQTGYLVVGPARSLKQGLLLAAKEDFDVAILDVNLGRETSAAIADHLLTRNIPFAFSTGYSDSAMLPEHLRDVPKSNKPYVINDMREMIDNLLADSKQPDGARRV